MSMNNQNMINQTPDFFKDISYPDFFGAHSSVLYVTHPCSAERENRIVEKNLNVDAAAAINIFTISSQQSSV